MIRVQREGETVELSEQEFERQVTQGELPPETPLCYPAVTGSRFVPAGSLELYRDLREGASDRFRSPFTLRRVPVLTLCLLSLCIAATGVGLSEEAALLSQGAKSASQGRTVRSHHVMQPFRTFCAYLLALPLLGSTANHFLGFVEPPSGDYRGIEILESLRAGGLMVWVALAHGVIGALLLVPRSRFLAGLLQLPVSVGIVIFNVMLFPPGAALAIGMLAVNLGLLLDSRRLQGLVPAAAPMS